MRFRQRNQPVQALATYRANDALANRIRSGTSRRRLEYRDAQLYDRLVQVRGKDTVAIMEQVFIPTFQSNRLTQLLQGPGCTRMGGDIAMDQSAAAVLNHHEYVQQAKCCSNSDKEIACDYPLSV
jgi:hypothetical protein